MTEELLSVESMDFSKELRKLLSESKIQSLLEMFSRHPPETEKIENYIVNNYVKPSEITIAVIKHLEQNCFAPIAYDSEDYGCWKMHIFDKEPKIKIAGYWDE